MDVDLLSKMVKELILDNNRVILPGLGVFYTEIVPASFSDKGYTLNPPYRKLHFRANNEQNGMLASLYASYNSIEADVAAGIIADFMQGLKQVLLKNKVVILPGLGRIRATRENNFFFVAEEDLDIYPDGFGLEPVSLKSHRNILERKQETANAPMQKVAEEIKPVNAEPAERLPVQNKPEKESAKAPAEQKKTAVKTPVEKKIALYFKEHQHIRTALIIAAAIIAAAGLALLTFLVLAQACPDFIDNILYDPEQLEILNYGKYGK